MAYTAGKTWANGDLLLYTEVNSYIGSSGNLFETLVAKATAAGQMLYATGANAVAVISAGSSSQVLIGGTAPAWGSVTNAMVSASAAIEHTKLSQRQVCAVQLTANQSISDSTWTALSFGSGTEVFDYHGWHDTSTNPSRITPTKAGTALILARCAFAANATGIRVIAIRINGSATHVVEHQIPAGSAVNIAINCMVMYPVNGSTDYIEAFVYQSSGGALNALGAAINYSGLEVCVLPGAA